MKRILSVALMFAASIAAQLPTKLADLGGALGANPSGPSAVVSGNLYFTCASGGAYGGGTLVTHVPGVGTFKIIDFNQATTGSAPNGVTSDGQSLFIALGAGGLNGVGAICTYSLQTGLLSTLWGYGSYSPAFYDGGFVWFIESASSSTKKLNIATGVVSWVPGNWSHVFAGGGFVALVSFGGTPSVSISPTGGGASVVRQLGNNPGGFSIEDGDFRWFSQTSSSWQLDGVVLTSGVQSSLILGSSLPGSGSFSPQGPWTQVNQCRLFPALNGLGLHHDASKLVFAGSNSTAATSLGYSVSSIARSLGGSFLLMKYNGLNSNGTLLWYPDPILATASTVGVSCGSTTLQLGYGNPPRLGESFPLTISGAPAFSQGTYFFSAPTSVVTPVSGCGVYLDVATISTLGTLFTTPFGAHSLPIPLPTNPAIAGAPARIQALVLPPNGGFQLTNGLDITLGF